MCWGELEYTGEELRCAEVNWDVLRFSGGVLGMSWGLLGLLGGSWGVAGEYQSSTGVDWS